MKIQITVITFATLACLSSCKDEIANQSLAEIPDEQSSGCSVVTNKTEKSQFDFEATLSLIKRINNSGSYELFQSEWEGLRFELQQAAANGLITTLLKEQQSELWWAIEYLRGCAHPEIFSNHNEEIIPILFSFDLPDLNQQLKGILVDSGQQ